MMHGTKNSRDKNSSMRARGENDEKFLQASLIKTLCKQYIAVTVKFFWSSAGEMTPERRRPSFFNQKPKAAMI